MPALLRIIDGPQSGTSAELRPGQRLLLGRGQDCDLHVLDSWASRRHCAVSCEDDAVYAEDLNTKNGTYLGGRRIERTRVPDGALLQIGTTTIQVFLRPTNSTVVTLAPAPVARRRTARAVATLAVAGLVLVGLVAGAIHIFQSDGTPKTQKKATGVSWGEPTAPKKKRGFGLFTSRPARTTVAITSEPTGATVFVDDEFRGATPLDKVELTVGEHMVRVQKAGYQVHRGTIAVASGQAKPVHFALTLSQRGSLVIRSKPDGASVFLDDDYRGKTPLRLDDLEPHNYALRIVKANFADWQKEVAVLPNEVVTLDAALSQREIGYYLAALAKDPNNVSYHTELAHLYLLERKVDTCMQHLALAIDITVAGRDTTKQGAYTARLVWLMSKIYFNDHFNYGDAAFVKDMQGRIDRLLADAAGKHPNSSTILSTAKRLYKRAGTPTRMAPIYLKMAAAQPTTFAHYANAVALLQQAGQHKQAADVLAKALKVIPDDYRVYLALGRVHITAKKAGVKGAREAAIKALNAALARCKDEAAKRVIRNELGKATK